MGNIFAIFFANLALLRDSGVDRSLFSVHAARGCVSVYLTLLVDS